MTATKQSDTAIIHAATGCVNVDIQDPCWTGAQKHGSREAEIEAILQALVWCINVGCRVSVSLHFDATTAGWPASGAWNVAQHNDQLRTVRALWQLYDSTHPVPLHAHHVKAHTGNLGNEVADMLANQARVANLRTGAPTINFGQYLSGRHAPIEWLWINPPVQEKGSNGLPEIEEDIMLGAAPAKLLQASQAFLTKEEEINSHTITRTTQLGIVTYNVCSLRPDGSGKHDRLHQQEYLRRQLEDNKIEIACLQETRARQDALIESSTHIRLIAAANKGKGGTEIWLLKRTKEGQSTGLTRKDVLVLHSHSELLVVRVRWKLGRYVVVSGHAPHGSHSVADIDQWWAQLRQCLVDHVDGRQEELLLGLDANAHCAEEALPGFSSHGLEPRTNRAGMHLQQLVNDFELIVPSTFADWHTGDTWTWTLGTTAKKARCDYVAIPKAWNNGDICSQPLTALDAGTTTRDHTALAVWVERTYVKPPRFKVKYDREGIRKIPEKYFAQLGQTLSEVEWGTNVHKQAVKFTDIIQQWLVKNSPITQTGPKKGYIRTETWQIRDSRIALIRLRRKFHQLWQRHELQVALRSWYQGATYTMTWDDQLHVAVGILRELRLLEATLDSSKRTLSKSLRTDRTIYLEEIAQTADQGDPKDLFKTLRRAGVGGRKKRSAIQPLPTLRKEDGEVVTTFAEYADTWRRFFAEQEDGVEATPEELLELSQHGGTRGHVTEINWQDLPTLTQMERALRMTKTGKAVYDDMIPGELLHYGAKYLAPAALNLMYKQWLCGEEALIFKGGALIPAYKGKGNTTQCASYRSLLISSALGKVYHRLFREELMQSYVQSPLPMQFGGRPNISVLQAVHTLQLFQHVHYQAKRSTALLFVDISNAFYRLFRQQLVNMRGDPRTPETLFEKLNLPPEAFEEFRQHLRQRTAIDDTKCPTFLKTMQKSISLALGSQYMGRQK